MPLNQTTNIRASEEYDDTLDVTQAETSPQAIQDDLNFLRTLSRLVIDPTGDWFSTPVTDLATLNAALGDIDSALSGHLSDTDIHFTEASIDHANILGVGTNTHAQIDSHLASTANPHSVTLGQVGAAAAVHAHVATDVTDFEVAVSANLDVAANTAKVSADGSIDTHSDVATTGAFTPDPGDVLAWSGTQWEPEAPGGAGLGDVTGPGSSVDGATVVFDGVTGKIIKEATDFLKLSDALALPSAVANFAQLGIDPSDGILKIRKSIADGGALVSLEGSGGGSALAYQTFTPTFGQTVFSLSQAPSGVTLAFVNGIESTAFSVLGSTFTWLPLVAGFGLETTDSLDIYYET